MKTLASHIKAISSLFLLSVLLAPFSRSQSVTVERTNYFVQNDASTTSPKPVPFALNFNIRGGSTNMNAWHPAFYIPGSGGTPQTGASSATNTGTLNFSTTPNNGSDFSFIHNFANSGALQFAYPGGAYGVKLTAGSPPSLVDFTAGLNYTGATYPVDVPQVTHADNGAIWYSGLRIKSTGVTTLTLSSFNEYGNSSLAPYGAIIGAGIYDPAGVVVGEASVQSHYLPTYNDPSVNEPAVTQLTIDGSWLTPGVPYTIELKYSIIASPPQVSSINSQPFQGLATYNKNTSLTITAFSNLGRSGSDFNADTQSDIVWRNTQTGEWAFWLMNGTTPSSYVGQSPMPVAWHIVGTGDFNADGKSDLIWQNPSTGEWAIWLMNGTAPATYVGKAALPVAWQITGTGDFNADGQSDLIWRNTQTGEWAIWLMNGTTPVSFLSMGIMPVAWQIVGTGDFNADGQSDLIWQNTQTGEWAFWLMNGTTPVSYLGQTALPQWRITGTGDFNADGKTDLIWRNTQTGEYTFWLMNGTTMATSVNKGPMPLEWQIVH